MSEYTTAHGAAYDEYTWRVQRERAESTLAMYGQHLVNSLPAMLATFWVQNPRIGDETSAAQWADANSDFAAPAGAGMAAGGTEAEPGADASAAATASGLATEELSLNLALCLHRLLAGKTDTSTGLSAGPAPLGLDVAVLAAAAPILDKLNDPSWSLRDRYVLLAARVREAFPRDAAGRGSGSGSGAGAGAGASAASAAWLPSLGPDLGDIVDPDQLLIPALNGYEVCVPAEASSELRARIMRNDDELTITKFLASVGGQTVKRFAVRTSGLMVGDWLLRRLRDVTARTPQLLYATLHAMGTVGIDNKPGSEPPLGFAPCGVVSLAVAYALDVQARFESGSC